MASARNPIGAAERRQRLIVLLTIGSLHVFGGIALVSALAEASPVLRGSILATAATAYSLGVRHAFDADHIAAIDNANRHLAQAGRPSLTVGLWFSLGHSTVVTAMCLALVLGLQKFSSVITAENSAIRDVGGVVGLGVSAIFLLSIGILNAGTLIRRQHLRPSSLGSRLSTRFGTLVSRPWKMYIIGLLFGLGFDTATEIGLLSLTIVTALGGESALLTIALPLVFAAGMSTFDTVQGALARSALDSRTGRLRAYPNLVAVVSCTIAIYVGFVELCTLLTGVGGGPPMLAWMAGWEVNFLGVALTAIILATLLIGWSGRRRRPNSQQL